MPTKTKTNTVIPTFTQQEAKDLAQMLARHIVSLHSIGNQEQANYCEALRGRVVQASGKVPDA